MVQRIRIRGHVVRLFGVMPSTSRAPAPECPICGAFYNDGKNRQSLFLCCGYEYCLECVVKRSKFYCPSMEPQEEQSNKFDRETLVDCDCETDEENQVRQDENTNHFKMDVDDGDQFHYTACKAEPLEKYSEEYPWELNEHTELKPLVSIEPVKKFSRKNLVAVRRSGRLRKRA